MLKQLRHLLLAGLFLLPPAYGAAPIIIGHAIDLSGPNASLGRDYVAGIKTGFDAVNAAGGINGRPIRYIVRDDAGDPAGSAAAAGDLLEREQAEFLIGGIGDATVRAVVDNPAFRRKDQLLFAPLASGAQAHGKRVLYWRPGYREELRHIFSHFARLGIADVGVVRQDTPEHQEAWRSLQAEAASKGIRLTHASIIGTQEDGIVREARQMAAARPGFVLVLADSIGTALFIKAFRRHEAQTFVAGTSLTNLNTLRELAGKRAAEWTVFSQVVPNPGASGTPLQMEHLAMMRKYRDEGVSALTLEGYAAARTLVKMIQASRRSGPGAIEDFLARGGSIDIGGLIVRGGENGLSTYLDIALLSRGGMLKF